MSDSPQSFQVQDAALLQSAALPAAEGAAVHTANVDCGPLTGVSSRQEECEALLTYPALTLAQLPNTSVMTYQIQVSNSATFATGVQVIGTVTQTGATGTASQPGGTLRAKLPSNGGEYLRAVATADANGADASGASMTLQLVF